MRLLNRQQLAMHLQRCMTTVLAPLQVQHPLRQAALVAGCMQPHMQHHSAMLMRLCSACTLNK